MTGDISLAAIQLVAATIPPNSARLSEPSLRLPTLQPDKPRGIWECLVCERSIVDRNKDGHLSGNPHRKKQAAWDTAVEAQRRKKEELGVRERKRAELAGKPGSEAIASDSQPSIPDRCSLGVDAVRRATVRPGMWECEVCERAMMKMSKKSHLQGSPHGKKQQQWEAERRKEKEEAEDELRKTDQIKIAEEKRRKEEDEFRRTEQIRIAEEECAKREELRLMEHIRIQKEKERLEEVAFQRAEQIRIVKEKGKEKKEREEFHRTERIKISEDEQRIRQELQSTQTMVIGRVIREETERMRGKRTRNFEGRQKENLKQIHEERRDRENEVEQKNQRWGEERAAELTRIGQIRKKAKEEEDQRRENQRRQEEENQRRENERRQKEEEAENQRKENQRRQEEAAERMRIGQLRKQAEDEENDRRENQRRLEEENQRREEQRRQEEEAENQRMQQEAAELTRIRQVRKQAEEELEKEELKRAEEQAKAQQISRQEQIQAEYRQRETARIYEAEQQSIVTNNFSGYGFPGNLIQPLGFMHQGGAGVQSSGEDQTHQAIMIQYMQWQAMVQETYLQQVWQQQLVTETYPMPITSVTDLPPILYRVYDKTSVSKYGWEGFTAASRFMPRDPTHFKYMVQLHGNWNSSEGTPFVSVTSSPDAAAWHVSHKQASGNETGIMVALIDTATLLGPCQTRVWKMHHARDHFGLRPWTCDRRAFDHEYICALRIPARAIFACCRPEFFMELSRLFLKSLETRTARCENTVTGG